LSIFIPQLGQLL